MKLSQMYSNEKGAGSVMGFADLIAGDLNIQRKRLLEGSLSLR